LKAVHIYVDGSCEDNRNVTKSTSAGWGYCVIVGDSGRGRGQGELVEEKSGRVITNDSDIEFLGAEVGSNNTAELSAIAHALRWVIVNSDLDNVQIRTDSTYAGNVTSGNWKAKANKVLVKRVQGLWEGALEVCNVEWEHVRAHRGHRWNERADHLAFKAMKGESPIPLQFWKPGMR
jgi:ribonuclease HI